MILQDKKRDIPEHSKYLEWFKVFVWLPVRLDDGRVVWLEDVMVSKTTFRTICKRMEHPKGFDLAKAREAMMREFKDKYDSLPESTKSPLWRDRYTAEELAEIGRGTSKGYTKITADTTEKLKKHWDKIRFSETPLPLTFPSFKPFAKIKDYDPDFKFFEHGGRLIQEDSKRPRMIIMDDFKPKPIKRRNIMCTIFSKKSSLIKKIAKLEEDNTFWKNRVNVNEKREYILTQDIQFIKRTRDLEIAEAKYDAVDKMRRDLAGSEKQLSEALGKLDAYDKSSIKREEFIILFRELLGAVKDRPDIKVLKTE